MERIRFNSKRFMDAMAIGGCFSDSGKFLPILKCVKISVKGSVCTLLSYDNMNAIKTTFENEGNSEECVFCINRIDIERYVSLIDDEYFDIEVDNEGHTAKIITSTGAAKFSLDDVKEYPILNIGSTSTAFVLDANLLGYWIQKGSNFIYNDSFELNHQNMHFIIKDKRLHVFFFGYNKMYYDNIETDIEGEIRLSIDRNSFPGILNMIKDEETVTIYNSTRNIMIKGKKSMLLSRKEDFKMHNYLMLLEYKPMFESVVNKKKLMSIIMRALNIHSASKMAEVTFHYTENGIEITSENMLDGKSIEEHIESQGGEEFTQTYNAGILKLAVSGLSSNEISILPSGDDGLVRLKNMERESESTYISPYKTRT